MASSEVVELSHTTDNAGAAEHDPHALPDEAQQFSLPPVDGGKDAWLVLFACFILEALVWGFPFAYGVFNDYYARQPQYAGHTSAIAAIGTTSTGLMYFGAIVILPILKRFPHLRKTCAVTGFIILLSALLGASFATTLPQLLATQGVLYAVGGSIHYFPAFLYLDEWFVARRGLAYGTVWAGAGLAGVALPLTLSRLLDVYGAATTLRAWAVATTVLTVPALCALRPRVDRRGHGAAAARTTEMGFVRSPAMWVLVAGNTIQGLGYFIPTLFMPLYASAVGLDGEAGTVAVSLANGSSVLGAVATGYLVDRYHVTTAINVCAVGTVAAVFLFWSFAVYAPVLYVFAVLYGMFAGGFSATWSGMTGVFKGKWPATETSTVIAIMSASKGVGAVLSGPLSGALVDADAWKGSAEYAWGSGYGLLILFTGVTAASTGMGWCGKKAGLL